MWGGLCARVHARVCTKGGRHPTAVLPTLLSRTLACQSKSVLSPPAQRGAQAALGALCLSLCAACAPAHGADFLFKCI